ncbi:MAG: serine/threonine protein kinase, partial [Psychrosphaera sp.]|nr:serine/threonine protein kinase [Psychrosphaera sp.]
MTKINNKSELTAEQRQQIAFAQDELKDYQFNSFIASGGMGCVDLAEDTRLQRPAAIKIIDWARQDNGLKEAQTLARLNHPNIVQIYQLVSKNQQMALVMEYLPGKTLQQCLREQLIPLEHKLQWLCQISSGLAAAHDAGIVHCDLKLSNVLLDENNTVKITDFGIAQYDNRLNHTEHSNPSTDQTSRGSMVSMSPEQLQNQPIDFRSDLFSLGILAFQMIVGQHPFGAGSAAQIGKRIVETNPMDATEVTPVLPPTLAKLLNQLLTKEPQQRPQSTTKVAQRLSQILTTVTQQEILNQQTEVFDVPDGTVATIVSKPKINKRLLLAAAGILLAITAAVLLNVGKNSEPPVRYIAVLQPSYAATDKIDPSQKDLLRGTIDEAIRQSVINTKGLQLISRKEVKAINGSVKMIGEATGATDILTTELDCDQTRCNVTLSQLGGKNW